MMPRPPDLQTLVLVPRGGGRGVTPASCNWKQVWPTHRSFLSGVPAGLPDGEVIPSARGPDGISPGSVQAESVHEAFIRWLLGSECPAASACNSNLPGLGSSAGFPGHRACRSQMVPECVCVCKGRQAVGSGMARLAVVPSMLELTGCVYEQHRLNYSELNKQKIQTSAQRPWLPLWLVPAKILQPLQKNLSF